MRTKVETPWCHGCDSEINFGGECAVLLRPLDSPPYDQLIYHRRCAQAIADAENNGEGKR